MVDLNKKERALFKSLFQQDTAFTFDGCSMVKNKIEILRFTGFAVQADSGSAIFLVFTVKNFCRYLAPVVFVKNEVDAYYVFVARAIGGDLEFTAFQSFFLQYFGQFQAAVEALTDPFGYPFYKFGRAFTNNRSGIIDRLFGLLLRPVAGTYGRYCGNSNDKGKIGDSSNDHQ